MAHGALRSSTSLKPCLCLVNRAEVPSNLEFPALDPHLRLVDLAVLRIQDDPALVAIPAQAEVLDDDEPDDGLVLVGARTLGARLRLTLVVVGLGEADDLAEELAALLVELHLGLRLAALIVNGVPFADQRISSRRHVCAKHNSQHEECGKPSHVRPPLPS